DAVAWYRRGHSYAALKQWGKAIADQAQAIQLKSDWPSPHNDLAWWLATCPEASFRNPSRAVKLAERAVELAPNDGSANNTLGVARYRAGDWKAAIAALERSMKLRKGGDASDWLFLAMADWKLGHPDKARRWYDQAVQWLEKNREALAKDSQSAEEIRRFR